MLDSKIFNLFIEPLESAGINYVITGSVAVIVYGDPRMTHDIDMVIDIKRSEIPRIIEAFPLESFYCPPEEVIMVETRRMNRGHFNIIHHATGFKADIYPIGSDSFLRWAVENARMFEVGGTILKLAPPEYVVVKKLEFFREGGSSKHPEDIRSMLDSSGCIINKELLMEFINKYGLLREWQTVSAGR